VARKATYHWELTTGHYSFPYRGGFMSKLPRFSFQVGLMLAFVMASLIGLAAKADPGPEPQPVVIVFKTNPAADDFGLLTSAATDDASIAIDGVHAGHPLSGTLRAAEPCKSAVLPICRASAHPTNPGLSLGRSPGVPFPAREPPPLAVSYLSPAQPPGAGAGIPLFDAW
jgi:hypothetical protein